MSTVNATPNAQNPPKLPERMTPRGTEPRVTAADIENDCPPRLREIGREITERLAEARKHVDAHETAINNLIVEAKGLCDSGGFNKFRELLCPQLHKSQAYVLLAIATGKKTLGEHRNEERERKQKTRATQKAATANSGTVPENSEAQGTRTEDGKVETAGTVPGQSPGPAKPRRAVTPGDEAMRDFTVLVMELNRRTAKRPPERFSATAVPVEVIARLGRFFTDLATLKKSEAVKPAPITALPDKGDVPVGQSAGDKRANTTLEACLDKVA
jgi:hypothetical protein